MDFGPPKKPSFYDQKVPSALYDIGKSYCKTDVAMIHSEMLY